MGLLTTSGSLARVIGPIFVSFIYEKYGTWLLFGLVALSLALSFIVTTLAYRQLVPYDLSARNRPFLQQIQFWKGWTGLWHQKERNGTVAIPNPPTNNGRSLHQFQSISEQPE